VGVFFRRMALLDDAAVAAFIATFYGYGNWSAPVWFVGMEEGGGGTAEEIARRIAAWHQRGESELEDLVEYHEAIGVIRHFGAQPALQSTWSKLIRILFAMHGQTPTNDDLRRVQADRFGRRSGDTALLELLPLPSPGTNRWPYAQLTTIPYLSTRDAYVAHVRPARVRRLRERLAAHRPRFVIFYGAAYLSWWSEIAGVSLVIDSNTGFAIATREGTTFAVAKHPAARGLTTDYFASIGAAMASRRAAESSD
jgi:hypothetical protein